MSDTYQRLKKKMGDTYSPDDLVAAIEFRRNAYELNKEQMSTLLGISIFEYNQFLYGTFVLPLEARRRAGVIGVPLSVLLAQPVAVETPEPELIYQVRQINWGVGYWLDATKIVYDNTSPSERRVLLMEVPKADVADYENALGKAEPGLPAGVCIREAGKHWPPESVPGEATFHKKIAKLSIAARVQGYVMGAYRETLTERGIVFPCVDDKDNKRLTPGTREHAEWLADKIVNEGFFNEQAAELLRKWPEYEVAGTIASDGFFIKKQGIPRVDGRTVYTKKA